MYWIVLFVYISFFPGVNCFQILIMFIQYDFADDVFLPKDVDLDNVDMDETEREVEYFKR